MEGEQDADRREAGPGRGWLAVAVGAGVAAASAWVGTAVALVVGPRGMHLLLGPAWGLGAWWFSRGAWLRTRWGRPRPEVGAPWDEPALTDRRAVLYVGLAVLCVVAAGVALSIQALIA